jgi:hypothetical protein
MLLRGRAEGGSWFDHVAGWWARRGDPYVLILHYDDLVNDLEGSIRKIADFCGIEVPDDQMPRILERSSFAFMKQHESQFDHTSEVRWEGRVQQSAFLRKGQVGEGVKSLSPEENVLFDRMMEKKLGSFRRVPAAETRA